MARALEDIVKELDAGYQPDRQRINDQINALPGQLETEEASLKAKEQDYFTNTILGGARERGVAFGGIPEGERARYGAMEFLPAVARLKQSGVEARGTLLGALTSLDREQREKAMGLRQQELDRDEQIRQAELTRQNELAKARYSAGSSFTPTLGSLTNPTSAGATQRKDKGYEFKDQFGNPISAAAYAAAVGVPFRQLLQTMANSGDAGARTALGFVGDDFGYDPRKVNNKSLADLYNSLVWGTGRSASAYSGGGPLSVAAPPAARGLSVR